MDATLALHPTAPHCYLGWVLCITSACPAINSALQHSRAAPFLRSAALPPLCLHATLHMPHSSPGTPFLCSNIHLNKAARAHFKTRRLPDGDSFLVGGLGLQAGWTGLEDSGSGCHGIFFLMFVPFRPPPIIYSLPCAPTFPPTYPSQATAPVEIPFITTLPEAGQEAACLQHLLRAFRHARCCLPRAPYRAGMPFATCRIWRLGREDLCHLQYHRHLSNRAHLLSWVALPSKTTPGHWPGSWHSSRQIRV